MAVGVVLSLIAGDSTKGFAAKAVMLGTPFLAGMCAWIWRDKVPLHGPLIALVLVAGFFGMKARLPGSAFLTWVALSWATLYLALVPAGRIRAFNKIGDWSFGIYIYAFPVQQTVVSMFPGIGIAALFAVAMPVTLVLACLSWQLIESRALDHYRSSRPMGLSTSRTPLSR
jgi:peptidoglycan/LPS O-acetylase OafA/YrhL